LPQLWATGGAWLQTLQAHEQMRLHSTSHTQGKRETSQQHWEIGPSGLRKTWAIGELNDINTLES
jgi:hypothetical protein